LAFLGKVKSLVFVNRPVYVYLRRSQQHVSAGMAMFDASDMCALYRSIDGFLSDLGITGTDAEQVRREARHTLVHYAIVHLVRACWQMNTDNRTHLYRQLHALVSAPVLRESLPCYAPRSGHSRLLPVLMRLKWVRLLAVIAKRKGQQRYGKPKVPNHEA
jgi:hypothetical protein